MNEGEGEKRFNEHCLRVFFKWEGKRFESIRKGKISLQTPHF